MIKKIAFLGFLSGFALYLYGRKALQHNVQATPNTSVRPTRGVVIDDGVV